MTQLSGFTIYRSFRYLSNRQLLYLQAELQSMELELFHLDETEAQAHPEVLRRPIHVQGDAADKMRELMERMKKKYMEYGTSGTQIPDTCEQLLMSDGRSRQDVADGSPF
jgi:hypothetical protein